SYFKKDMILHYRGRYTKSLHANLEKIGTSMCVDAGEIESTDTDIQYVAAKLDDDGSDKENSESKAPDLFDECNIKQQEKTLYVTCKSEKFACPYSFNVIREHDCQDIVAVLFFIEKPVVESVASSSLESYLRQKDDNGRNKNELSLPQKRDTILDEPYHKVEIVEVIGNGKVVVDITFESDMTQRIVQLADIIGYADEQVKKKIKLSKDSHGNIVVCTMPYRGKKGELHLTSTCPVDTSLTLIQSVFTQQNIYSQAAAFAIADPISRTHLLIKVFDRMRQKQWVEAKFLWVESLPSYNKLETGCVSLFGGLSELFFEQFFHDSLDWNLLVVKINVAGINITDEGFYLKSKDLLEEINFSSENAYIKQRYRLMGASFCDDNHHVADVRFENIKNAGWYQYDGLGKTYCARAMYIGSSRPSHKNDYAMDFAIYVKI
ncbi:17291_t:CDS:2, partial [Cetraspora pellucida]